MTDVRAKVFIIYEAFVEGKLEALKHLPRAVHGLYFEPKYEQFQPRTMWSLSNAFTSAFGTGSDSAIRDDGEAGRIPGDRVLASFLRKHGGAGRTADVLYPGCRAGDARRPTAPIIDFPKSRF